MNPAKKPHPHCLTAAPTRRALAPIVAALALLTLALTSAHADAPQRTWTHDDGTEAKGQYVGVTDEGVQYKRAEDDETVTVALENLGEADRVYVRSRTEPARPPVEPDWLDGFAVRYRLRLAGLPEDQSAQSVLAQIPTGGWSLAQGADIVVQRWTGDTVPLKVHSYSEDGDAMIQFPQQAHDCWYWVYVRNPEATDGQMQGDPGQMQEGIVAEFRAWEGESLQSWEAVRQGLIASERVTDNVLVDKVLQSQHPTRPGQGNNFAVSYRGYLDLDETREYQLLLTGHDATFLFIDGEMVMQRVGSNQPVRGDVPLDELGTKIELSEGIHPFEIHQAIGNNPRSNGMLALMSVPPDSKKASAMSRDMFARPMLASVTGIESAPGHQGAMFTWGIEDVLVLGSQRIYLVRFQAIGEEGGLDNALKWQFGADDERTATGRQAQHLFFDDGDHAVTLSAGGDLPPFRQMIHLYPRQVKTGPDTLQRAVSLVGEVSYDHYNRAELSLMLRLLQRSGQPNRWKPMIELTGHLLDQELRDPGFKAQLYQARITALAHDGQADAAIELKDEAAEALKDIDVLRAQVMLTTADALHRPLKRYEDAGKLYGQIIDEFSRLRHPAVRTAAIHYGDLLVELGEMNRARDMYQAAKSLGDDQGASAAAAAVQRGSRLRVVEQQLRGGNIDQARQLLQQVETDSPEQKLSGFYRFLHGEMARADGQYDQAIRDYELVLRLEQWSGFHDRSMLGLIKTYRETGDLEEALHWLDTLSKTYPDFYDEQALSEVRDGIETQQARAQSNGANGASAQNRFATSFEADESDMDRAVRPSVGIDGRHVSYQGELSGNFGQTYSVSLKNVPPGGAYWVSVWYRTMLGSERHTDHPDIDVAFWGSDNERADNYIDRNRVGRTFGKWHRMGAIIGVPDVTSGRVHIKFGGMRGLLEVDRIRIAPISMEMRHKLQRFREGEDQ